MGNEPEKGAEKRTRALVHKFSAPFPSNLCFVSLKRGNKGKKGQILGGATFCVS